MSTTSNKNRKILIITTIAFICILCAFHYYIRTDVGDVPTFREYMGQYSLLEFVKWRYEEWSSRFLLEGCLYLVLSCPYIVFATINIFCILVIVFFSRKIFALTDLSTGILMILLLFYPMDGFVIVGIQASSTNYLWSFAAGLIALYPIAKYIRHESFQKWEYPLYLLAAIYGGNMEMIAALLFGFYFSFLLFFFKKKEWHWLILVQTIVGLGSVLFSMFNSGNISRGLVETDVYWPDFANFSLGQKLYNGIFVSTNFFMSIPNIVFFILSISLCALAWKRERRLNLQTIISSIPFLWELFVIVLKLLDIVLQTDLLKWLNGINNAYTGSADHINPIPSMRYLMLAIQICLYLCVGIAFWYCFQNIEKKLLVELILCAGFLTRVIMGFSASLYVSGTRTFAYLYFSFYICIILAIQEMIKRTERPKNEQSK